MTLASRTEPQAGPPTGVRIRPMARGCVFCGKRPTTKEHALPLWLAGPLGAEGLITHEYLEPPDGAEPTRRWQARAPAIEVNDVCGPCNNGWMARLESEVRPFLGPMIEGDPATLSPVCCEGLTTWLLKTVLMLQLAEPMERQIVRPQLYAELYELRRPSERLQAWVARNKFNAGAAAGTRGLTFQRGELPPEQTWAHALVLGHVTLVLVDLGIGNARPILVEPPLAHALGPLWPDPLGGNFPPPAQLGGEQQRLILHLLAHSAR
jgi:hypothetical protein